MVFYYLMAWRVDASPFIAYFHESFIQFLPLLCALVCACVFMCVSIYFRCYRRFQFSLTNWIRSLLVRFSHFPNQHQHQHQQKQQRIKCFKLYSFIRIYNLWFFFECLLKHCVWRDFCLYFGFFLYRTRQPYQFLSLSLPLFLFIYFFMVFAFITSFKFLFSEIEFFFGEFLSFNSTFS